MEGGMPSVDRRLGVGRLRVARRFNKSVACEAYASSPLRLLTPKNHGHAAWVFITSYGGGLVDGDALAIQAKVEPGACAFVSTQASTKVYKSPNGTSVEMTAEVGARGLLILLPDPVICFARSRYQQRQEVVLDTGAGLVLVDWVSSGRREYGERWAFDEYVSQTVVQQDGLLRVHDSLALRSADGDLSSRFRDWDVLAVVMVLGKPLEDEVRSILKKPDALAPTGRLDELVTVAPIGKDGCVLRIGGRSVEKVWRIVQNVLGFVPTRLGDNPWARKW